MLQDELLMKVTDVLDLDLVGTGFTAALLPYATYLTLLLLSYLTLRTLHHYFMCLPLGS